MRTFTVNGVTYKSNETDTYFYKSTGAVDKKGNQMMMRIGKPVFEKAYEEWAQENADAIYEEKQKKQAESDRIAEERANKKKARRRSKDVAFKTTITLADDKIADVTLTAKQVAFIKRMPEDDFYENGLESTLWIDVYCDTIADEFNPMAVGAMVSTLREKDLIIVDKQRVNGKISKYMAFTELGQAVAKELGLK